jgi:hypothetical protein
MNNSTIRYEPYRTQPCRAISLAMAVLLAFSPIAHASLPDGIEVFGNMPEVSDSNLGQMRGKFASNDQVLYFGVEMVSQWLTPTGNLVTAGANLNVDFRGNLNSPIVQYIPTVSMVQQGTSTSQTGGVNAVSGGGGLSNVQGVSQSIQVAGQSNSIHNGMDIQVDATSSAPGGVLSGAVQSQAGALSQTGVDGSVATVTLANNSLGVEVLVPGQGQVLQQIKNQGMFQSARIGGDLNQIHNAITMHIGLSNGVGANLGGAYAALQGLKNLPQTGMF